MNARLLTESGWKAVLSKHKIRDNGLQRALAAYEDVEEEEHDNRLEAIALVTRLSGQLKRVRDVAANSEVIDYLEELEGAAETEERDVTREKAAAAKAEAANQRRNEAEDAEDDDESVGDYKECLLLAFRKLKSMRGQVMQFIVCDARPFCGIMIAKRITPKHKQQLTEVTGGSKRFLRIGTCSSDGDRYIFTPEQPVQGLARKLQVSVKNFTGKKLPIVVGDESAEDGDEESE